MANICSLETCDKPVKEMGYCNLHYLRVLRHGDPQEHIPSGRSGKPPKKCKFEDCDGIAKGAGFCHKHYYRFRVNGDPNKIKQVKRFDSIEDCLKYHIANKKTDANDCWISPNKTNPLGYVRVEIGNGKSAMLHRLSLALTKGFDLDSKESVHHTCANRACFNPDHLQPISQRENMAEMHERNFYIKRIAELEKENQALRDELGRQAGI